MVNKQYSIAVLENDVSHTPFSGAAIVLQLVHGTTVYDSIEEFLNSVGDERSQAFLQTLKLDVTLAAQLYIGSNKGIVELWKVEAPDMSGGVTAYADESPAKTYAEKVLTSLGAKAATRLGKGKFVDAGPWTLSTSETFRIDHYEFEITIHGNKNNPYFLWSDEFLVDPQNRTFLVATIVGPDNFVTLGVNGSGVAFVDNVDAAKVLQ